MLFSRIQKQYNINQIEINSLKTKIQRLPAGEISCNRNGKHTKWFLLKDKQRSYLPKDRKSLAEQLALKKYYCTKLKEKEKEQRILQMYLNHVSPDSTAEEMWTDPRYKSLLASTLDPLSTSNEDWANADYSRNPYKPEALIISTPAGYKVRSKSESLISIALTRMNIAHRYECRLGIGANEFYPDFTIIHPETGDMYYWEHFGMMDSPSYAAKTCDKISHYIRHGILPTINLIMTFETSYHPFDYDQAVQIIQQYFQ